MVSRCKLTTMAALFPLFLGCEAIDEATSQTHDSGQAITESFSATEADSAAGSASATDEAAHGLNMADVKLKGAFDFRSASITANMTGVTLSSSSVSLTWDPHSWPYYDGYSEGVVCFIYKTGGGWVGGYFDWSLANVKGYTWGIENIYEMIGSPASGTECGFFILSKDTHQRSNVMFTTWP